MAAKLAEALRIFLNEHLSNKLTPAGVSLADAADAESPILDCDLKLLNNLLSIYTAALRLHRSCEAFQPQLESLPGQCIGDAVSAARDPVMEDDINQDGQGEEVYERYGGGYFDSLCKKGERAGLGSMENMMKAVLRLGKTSRRRPGL